MFKRREERRVNLISGGGNEMRGVGDRPNPFQLKPRVWLNGLWSRRVAPKPIGQFDVRSNMLQTGFGTGTR